MTDGGLALGTTEALAFRAQDRARAPWAGLAATLFSLIVIVAALYQARGLHLADLRAMVPRTPLFWATFVLGYLAGPVSEWIIYRRLWRVGPEAIVPLLRKLVYNELLLGYLGEAYFYGWARRRLALPTTPFGTVKDVAVMSAMAGNAMTAMVVLLALPFASLLTLGGHVRAIGWSLGIVLASSLAVVFLRRRIFSLSRPQLGFVFAIHVARIVATALLAAFAWHLVLPITSLTWWLVLAALRLIISRLPFLPNKDVVFAGVAVFTLGREGQIAALMTMMAGLILLLHILVATAFAIADLMSGGHDAHRAA
jgi:hypothetical protein